MLPPSRPFLPPQGYCKQLQQIHNSSASRPAAASPQAIEHRACRPEIARGGSRQPGQALGLVDLVGRLAARRDDRERPVAAQDAQPLGGFAARSSEGERDPKGVVERAETNRVEAGDIVGQKRLREADEGVAMDARFVLQAFVGADVNLCGQPIAT